MGIPRTLGTVTVNPGYPTPVYTGTVTAAVSFYITNGIATINLGATNLPTTGYNPGRGGPAGTIGGMGIAGGAPGSQVTLWGFTTATYFNGVTVQVIENNSLTGSFSFAFNHANVGSKGSPTADAGNTAPTPWQHYRAVRLECSQNLGTDLIYVGDKNVSSTKYFACLSLAGQLAIEIVSENIPADRIFIDGTANTDTAQISLIY